MKISRWASQRFHGVKTFVSDYEGGLGNGRLRIEWAKSTERIELTVGDISESNADLEPTGVKHTYSVQLSLREVAEIMLVLGREGLADHVDRTIKPHPDEHLQ